MLDLPHFQQLAYMIMEILSHMLLFLVLSSVIGVAIDVSKVCPSPFLGRLEKRSHLTISKVGSVMVCDVFA